MPKEPKTKTETFEHVYARLQEKVELLEQGGLSLDDAITLYEEGMALARACQERLDEAEQRITKLREALGPVERANGLTVNDEPIDYEYVAEDEDSEGGEDDYT